MPDTRTPSRLLALARLSRLPLAICAISNSQTALLLQNARGFGDEWSWPAAAALACMSFGLYCLASISNDIVDIRRDRVLAPHRPLITGDLSVQTAYLSGAAMLVLGIGGGIAFTFSSGGSLPSLFFLAWTVLLIFFYNLAAKFVGAVGILTIGLIAFFHASVAQPNLAVIWHPLLIMNHVVLVLALAYWLQGRRPKLSRAHRWGTIIGLLALNLFLLGGVALVAALRHGLQAVPERLGFGSELLFPLVAVGVFWAFAIALLLSLRVHDSPRELVDLKRRAGRQLAIYGLVWLVIYDIAFTYGYLREL